jgi:hypothetical protein
MEAASRHATNGGSLARFLETALSRERVIAYGWMFLAAQLILLAYLALRSHGVFGNAGDSSTDFMMIYASGRLAATGSPALVYDLATQSALQQHIFGGPLAGFFPFYYPPIYLIVCAALSWLPYYAGFALWVLATGTFFVAVLWLIAQDWRLAVALASFPAAIVNLGLGQNAFLTAGLLGLGVVLIDESPWLAGIAFAALAFKPHFLVLVPVALLAGRRWRTLAASIVTGLALIALSAALFGIDTWRAFVLHIPVAQAIYGGGTLGYWAQTSLFAAVRLLGGSYVLAATIHGAAMVAAAAAVAYGWWNDASLPVRATTLIAGTLICVPVNLSYDLLAAAPAVAFLCRGDAVPPLRGWERCVIVAGWLIAFAGRGVAEKFGVPLMPLIALGLLWIAVGRLRLESSAPCFRRPAPAWRGLRSRSSTPS